MMNYDLLPEAVKPQLPRLYATEGYMKDALAVVHFYAHYHSWHWYVSEFDGTELFFGLVKGSCLEYGYFSLTELEVLRQHAWYWVIRDEAWKPIPLREIEAQWKQLGC